MNRGQYNLNFIDWTNEWESAMEAMNNDPLESDIEGILNQEIIDIFNSLEGEENKGLSEAEMRKKFKI